MNHLIFYRYLLLLITFSSSYVAAGTFVELSPRFIKIDAPGTSTEPLVGSFHLGYKVPHHQIELVIMSSIRNDKLNQLTVDVTSAQSIFYRYISAPQEKINTHLILGITQIDIESSYPGVPDTTDSFDGVSFGIGFDEAFQFNPNLKLKLDLIQLYRGDDLNINSISLGLRYEF